MAEISRGKFDRLPRTPAGFTVPVFDDYGLRGHSPARPAGSASYPVLVHQVAVLLHASFRPHLAVTPLHFANPSPPSGWVEDLHLRAVDRARHTKKGGPRAALVIETAWVILNCARASAGYPALSMVADLSTAPKPAQ